MDDADTTNGRDTLRQLADAIDSGQLDSSITIRAGIAGALGALSDPQTKVDEPSADNSDE